MQTGFPAAGGAACCLLLLLPVLSSYCAAYDGPPYGVLLSSQEPETGSRRSVSVRTMCFVIDVFYSGKVFSLISRFQVGLLMTDLIGNSLLRKN